LKTLGLGLSAMKSLPTKSIGSTATYALLLTPSLGR
jgi:hypothetical protein